MNNQPTDILLYNKIKKNIYAKYPIHSAYRSGLLVKEYKKQFLYLYDNKINPYLYKKSKKKIGLKRWFLEEWKNQRNEVGYNKNGDYYRPTKRITKKTPITHNELSNTQKHKAIKLKKSHKRASFI